jgi:hypothetical protein
MSDDEAIALYGAIKKLAESMSAREAALDKKTAALNAAIAQIEQLPAALGKQTSQYIAAGVRQSIQDDFSRPIEAAVKGPIQELTQATYHARIVMADVGKESRFQTWTWLGIMVLLGVLLGAAGCYYFVQRDIGRIDDRLDSIQQQIAPAAPAQAEKPDTVTKGHRGSHER